jgi:hypothetical protein
MGVFGELFAKPFCRLTATLGVFVFLFGLVAMIENASNSMTFLLVCVIFSIVLVAMAGIVANSPGPFSRSKEFIMYTCPIVSVVMILFAGIVVQRAPTSRAAEDNLTLIYSKTQKREVWVACTIGSLMLFLTMFYASRFSDNVDEYTNSSKSITTQELEDAIKYLNDNNARPAMYLFYYLETKLKSRKQREQAVLQANLLSDTSKYEIMQILNMGNVLTTNNSMPFGVV